jgi:hypothetical protein
LIKLHSMALRPRFSTSMSAQSFNNWYWAKEDLIGFCNTLSLNASGSKALLRQRVAGSLPGGSPVIEKKNPQLDTDHFDWSNAILTGNTVITENVTFGPNFRNFMKAQIGAKFQCNGDFMAWVKDNPGSTLYEAIATWHQLEERKKVPGFRREIAICNNYLRYLREFQDNNPDLSYDDAKVCWQNKKLCPAPGGYVTYEKSDRGFLEPSTPRP